MADSIRVTGVAELARAFRKMDAELPKELKARFLKIAERVADVARNSLPERTGRARTSIKAKASPKGAGIAFGGSVAPYEPWLDFGGRVGRNRSIERERVSGGRYVYPAIASQKEETARAVELAITEVAHDAGFEAH